MLSYVSVARRILVEGRWCDLSVEVLSYYLFVCLLGWRYEKARPIGYRVLRLLDY